MPADYHTHTPLCMHADGTPEAYIDAAIAAGVTEYGITDHAPTGPVFFDDWRMRDSQLPEYIEWVERAKAHAGDKIPVRAGMECDWLPGCEEWIKQLRKRYSWDYLIGSVHYIQDGDHWDFDNPKWVGSRWDEANIEVVWTKYWDAYIAMADSGLFDILAHPDLIKKFGHRPDGDLRRFYEPVIDAIATSGAIIELNTAGWHKPCAEQYPHIEFLELARDGGIDLVISSDAHAPGEVARDFKKAKELARRAGYVETTLIKQGSRGYEAL
ncbi:histidinol-phosphatase [Rubritalea marina]|uniref:histidinol-phosphatase n=1 Tax=Rubritalea marina TaxID=361055 RepID=UPI0003A3ABCB|nr:histidinol-phosphatase [Rubritalea marina]